MEKKKKELVMKQGKVIWMKKFFKSNKNSLNSKKIKIKTKKPAGNLIGILLNL